MAGIGVFVTGCSSDDEKEEVPDTTPCFSGIVDYFDNVQGFAFMQIESVPSTTDYNEIEVGMGIVAVFPTGSSVIYKNGDIIDFQILTCEKYTSAMTHDVLPPSYICEIKMCK